MYIEVGAEFFKIYGGVYKLTKEELYDVREAINNDVKGFQKSISGKEFKELFGEIHGEKNKIIPKEFKTTGEVEPLIYNKNMYTFHKMDAEEIMNGNLEKTILAHYKALKPFTTFMRKALSEK